MSVHGLVLAPVVSSDMIHLRLCSSEVDTCMVPRTLIRFVERSFAVGDPWLWHSLPTDLCHTESDTELGEYT